MHELYYFHEIITKSKNTLSIIKTYVSMKISNQIIQDKSMIRVLGYILANAFYNVLSWIYCDFIQK